MEYRWIRAIDKFKDIASDWDEALIASGEDNPFLLSDFIITWWKFYSSNRKLMIFAGYDNSRVVSGMPLCITKRGFRNILEHTGAQTANLTHYFTFKAQPDFMDSFFLALKNNNEWDIFILSRVLESHALISQFRSLGAKGLKCSSSPAGFDGLIDLSKGYDFVLNNLPERLRRYLQSCRKKASLKGELKLDKISGSRGVSELFSEFREMSRKSFRLRGTFSAFEDSRYSDFFSSLLEVFDRRERLDAHRLSAGDKTLAISFGYRFGKGFKWILTAFNPDFQELRPGHILIAALIRESISRGDPYFDMYYGGELFYKQQWCNKMMPLKKVTIYRDNLLNRIYIGSENGLRSNRLFMYLAKNIYNFIRLKKYNAKKNN